MPALYVVENLSKGSILASRAQLAESFLSRARGLLGEKGLSEGEGLILRPCASIHTWFMPFEISVAFTDDSGQVLKVVPSLAPWRFAGVRGARAAVELPCGVLERTETERGDYLVWMPVPHAQSIQKP